MKDLDSRLRELIKKGTLQRGLVFSLLGAVIATLLLSIGILRTLFVCLLTVAGFWIGKIGDKEQFAKDTLNKVIPKKE